MKQVCLHKYGMPPDKPLIVGLLSKPIGDCAVNYESGVRVLTLKVPNASSFQFKFQSETCLNSKHHAF
jgi:hypothetical protein